MQIKNRQQLLIIVTVAAVALFAGDAIIVEPLLKAWNTRQKAIKQLRDDIANGKRLKAYETNDVALWDRRKKITLSTDPTIAAGQVDDAINSWAETSRASLGGKTPQLKTSRDGYSTYECHVDVTGTMDTLCHFIYCAETERLALRIDSVDLSTRDKTGLALTLGLQISGLILPPSTPTTPTTPITAAK